MAAAVDEGHRQQEPGARRHDAPDLGQELRRVEDVFEHLIAQHGIEQASSNGNRRPSRTHRYGQRAVRGLSRSQTGVDEAEKSGR